MDEKIKKDWTANLRSGDYAQGRKALRRFAKGGGDEHCCLGVLCDLYDKAHTDDASGWRMHAYTDGIDTAYDFPPPRVLAWAGLSVVNPNVGGTPLAECNDMGATFVEIADLIDEHL